MEREESRGETERQTERSIKIYLSGNAERE